MYNKLRALLLRIILPTFLITGFAYGNVSLRVSDIPSAANGSTIGVVVKVGNVNGLSSADIWLTYDNTKLTPTGLVTKGSLFSGFSIVSSTVTSNEVRVAMASGTPVNASNNSDVFIVYFNVLVSTGSTTIDFSKGLLNGTNIPTNTTPGTVTFTSLPTVNLSVLDYPNAVYGAVIGVPVQIGPYNNISSADIWLTYDTAMLQPTGVVDKGSLFQGFSLSSTTANAGEVRVALAAANPVNVSATSDIIMVYFNVLQAAGSTGIGFSKWTVNGGNIPSIKTDGTVSFATQTTSFTLPVKIVNPGETISVDIYAPSVIGVRGIDAWINYDPTVLSPVSALLSSALSTAGFILQSNLTGSGLAKLALAGGTPTNISGLVASISFQVVGTAGQSSALSFNKLNINEGSIQATTQSGSVTINTPPVLATIGNRTATTGSQLSFTVQATDVNGDAISYSSSNLPSGSTLNTSSGLFSWTPAATGTLSITFTATDSRGGTASQTISVSVTSGNLAPVLDTALIPSSLSLTVGVPYSLTLSATDPNGDPVTYQVSGAPGGSSLDPATGVFSWTPNSPSGQFTVTFWATDGVLSSVTGDVLISVSQPTVNNPPVLQLPAATYNVTAGDSVRFTPTASDADNNTLSFSLSGTILTATPTPTLNTTTGLFRWLTTSATPAGAYSGTITVSDGQGGTAVQSFSVTVTNANRPPVLQSLQNYTITSGGVVNFAPTASDPDNDPLIFSLSGNIATATPAPIFNTTTGQFNWQTTASTVAGTYAGIITVSDGKGGTISQPFSVTVSAANRPPVFGTLNNVAADQGATITFTVTASDPDGDPVTYAASGAPMTASPAATFNTTTGAFSWATTSAIAGNFTLTLTASDNKGGVVTKNIVITVGAVNRPPVLNPIGSKTVTEQGALQFSVSASDPDGQQVLVTAAPMPTGANFSYNPVTRTGQFNWAPAIGQAGPYTVTFSASDGQFSVSEAVSITVSRVSLPPVLAKIDNRSLTVGQTLAFQISGTDPTGREKITLSLGTPVPAGATFDPATGLFSFTPTQTQVGDVVFKATATNQSGLATSQNFTVTVIGVNHAPVISATTSQTVIAGQLLTFPVTASDPDNDALTLAASGVPIQSLGATFVGTGNTRTFSWTPAAGTVGNYLVAFTVTDPKGLSAQASVTITVGNANRPPAMSVITNKQVNAGATLSFNFTASDPDNNTLTLSVPDIPAGAVAALTAGQGTFSWSPTDAQVGSKSVTFIVSDGKLSVQQTITIQVLKVNHAPTIAPISDRVMSEGQRIDIGMNASDPENDPLLFVADSLPPVNATFDASTRLFSFSPNYTQAGTYRVSIRVSDPGGLSARQGFTIKVNDVNRPPSLGTLSNQSILAGNLLEVLVTASDPDNDPLTFTATVPTGATFNATTHVMRWTPTAQDVGSRQATFSVSDGKGGSDSRNITITVTTPTIVLNRPPIISPIGSQVVEAAQTLSLTVTATDPDVNQKPVLSATGLPVNATFDPSNGKFSFNPAYSQVGDYKVVFAASDGQVNTSLPVTISVVRTANKPPVLTGVNNDSVLVGNTLTFSVTASDPEGDNITLGARNTPPGANFNSATGVFTYTPTVDNAGTYTVTFVATDVLGASSEKSMSLKVTAPNRLPVFASLKNVNTLGDSLVQFVVNAVDPDNDRLTFSANLTGLTGATFDAATHLFNWRPPNKAQTYNVTFTVTDGKGTPVNAAVLIAVSTITQKVNSPPSFIPIAKDYVMYAGGSLSITLSATDPENDRLKYDATSLPDHSKFSAKDSTFTFNPLNSQSGQFNATFTVSDGKLSDNLTVNIQVNAVNRAPVLDAVTDRTVPEIDNLNFFVTAQDPDNDPLTISAENLPQNAQFNPASKKFSFSPALGQAGSYDVRFIARDPSGLADSATVNIQVTATNLPPLMSNIKNQTVTLGDLIEIVLDATDPNDPASSLVFSTDGALPAGAIFSPADRAFRWTPAAGQIGNFRLTFRVTDPGKLTSSQDVKITVNDPVRAINHPPVLTPIGDRSVNETENINFVVGATDPDVGNTVTLTVRGLPKLPDGATFTPQSGAGGATGTFDFTPGLLQSGDYKLTFRASDGNFVDEETITLTVIDKDVEPRLEGIANYSAKVGEQLNFSVRGFDDSGEPVVLSVQNPPSGAKFLAATGHFSFTPTQDQGGQTFAVVFRVTDASGNYVEGTSNIGVISVNHPPKFERIGNQTVATDGYLYLPLRANDPDPTDLGGLNYSIISAPSGIGLTPGNAISNEFGTIAPGNYPISVMVTDPGGLSDTQNFNLTVTGATPVNRPPDLSDPGQQSVAEGSPLSFTVTASDPDNDPLTLTQSGVPAGASVTVNANVTTFSWTPGFTNNGTYTVIFSATDNGGLKTEVQVTVTVQDVNVPPSLDLVGGTLLSTAGMKFKFTGEGLRLSAAVKEILTFNVNEGGKIVVAIKVSDPGGDLLGVSVRNLPRNAAFDGTGRSITFTPDYEQAGNYLVSIEVSDGVYTVTKYAAFQVANVNRPPVLRPIGNRYVFAGKIISFEVNAYDPDGDPVTYGFSGIPGVASLENNLFTFDTQLLPSGEQVGAVHFVFKAFDDKGGADSLGQDIAVVRPQRIEFSGLALAGAVGATDSVPIPVQEGIGMNLTLQNQTGGALTTGGSIDLSEISGPLSADVIQKLQGGGEITTQLASAGDAAGGPGGKVKTEGLSRIRLADGEESGFHSIRRGWGLDLSSFNVSANLTGYSDSVNLVLKFSYQDSDLVTNMFDLNRAFSDSLIPAAWDSLLQEFVLLKGRIDSLNNWIYVTIPFLTGDSLFPNPADSASTSLSGVKPRNIQIQSALSRYKYFTAGAILDYTPPAIAVFTKSFTTSNIGPYKVVAEVSDALTGVARVELVYQIEGLVDSLLMTLVGSNYEGLLPAQTVGKIIEYYIQAVDKYGNVSRNPEATSYIVSVSEVGPADLDGNGKVDIFDLIKLLTAWRTGDVAGGDVNGDGKVDVWDLLTLLLRLSGNAKAALSSSGANPELLLAGLSETTEATAPGDYRDFFGLRLDGTGPVAAAEIMLNLSPDIESGAISLVDDSQSIRVVASREGGKLRLLVFSLDGRALPTGRTLLRVAYRSRGGALISEKELSLSNVSLLDSAGDVVQASVQLEGVASLPRAYGLSQNYPNPFNPSTTISYDIPEGDQRQVKLSIFNIRGQLVATLVNEQKDPGNYVVQWEGQDFHGRPVASGVYFYRLESREFTRIRKMVLLK